MESLFALVGFLFVSAITPGPNNVIVLTEARQGGFIGALPAILGVILGSLVLLALIWSGTAIALNDVPSLAPIFTIVGACYVGGLGLIVLRQASRQDGSDNSEQADGLPRTIVGLAIFQLLNPKAWGLVATATAAASHASLGFLVLAALIILICTACLLLWAWCGSVIARLLEDRPAHRWLNRLLGLMLLASAALMLLGA